MDEKIKGKKRIDVKKGLTSEPTSMECNGISYDSKSAQARSNGKCDGNRVWNHSWKACFTGLV